MQLSGTGQLLQRGQVHYLVLRPEGAMKTALRNAPHERHLPAFKPWPGL
jgi:hypothetical protein